VWVGVIPLKGRRGNKSDSGKALYAVDETKVLSVKGEYYLWIVRDVKTRAVPFFMVRSARSAVHVLVILAAMGGLGFIEFS
jgi:hypothetical protein